MIASPALALAALLLTAPSPMQRSTPGRSTPAQSTPNGAAPGHANPGDAKGAAPQAVQSLLGPQSAPGPQTPPGAHASLGPPSQARPGAGAPQAHAALPPHASSPLMPPSAAVSNEPGATDAGPPVEPFDGSLAQGLAKMEALSDAKDADQALAVGASLLAPTKLLRWREEKLAEPGFLSHTLRAADPVFDFFGLQARGPRERAAVCYAMGVVSSRAKEPEAAAHAFERARELAGSGELRLDATYNLGVLALEQGEAARKEIPELNPGQAQAQPPPPPAGAASPGAPAAPDPLERAKAAYLHARTELVQRMKEDWKDADTRANVELVQRRLDELDRIQRQREEEKQKQKDQQKDQDNKDDQKDKQDPKDEDDKSQDPKDKQDSDKNGEKDQPKPDEQPKEEPKEEKPPEKDAKPDEQKPEDPSSKKEEPAEPTERLLTKEEMTRLFDLLDQAEQQGKKLERELRQLRRAKVKKDW